LFKTEFLLVVRRKGGGKQGRKKGRKEGSKEGRSVLGLV
jgi:hypothetical protein